MAKLYFVHIKIIYLIVWRTAVEGLIMSYPIIFFLNNEVCFLCFHANFRSQCRCDIL